MLGPREVMDKLFDKWCGREICDPMNKLMSTSA